MRRTCVLFRWHVIGWICCSRFWFYVVFAIDCMFWIVFLYGLINYFDGICLFWTQFVWCMHWLSRSSMFLVGFQVEITKISSLEWVNPRNPMEPVSQWVSAKPTISHAQPRFRMPNQRVRNGEWIMYPVEVLHESSPKVFKIISVMQQKGLEVMMSWMDFTWRRRNRRASNAPAATKLNSKWTWSVNQAGKTNLGNRSKTWTIMGLSWASWIEHCHGISGFEVWLWHIKVPYLACQ